MNIMQIFNTLSEKNFFTFSYIENSSSECYYPFLFYPFSPVDY